MRKSLKKTEVTFAFKISLLFGLILFASTLKENKLNTNVESMVHSTSVSISPAVFTSF